MFPIFPYRRIFPLKWMLTYEHDRLYLFLRLLAINRHKISSLLKLVAFLEEQVEDISHLVLPAHSHHQGC